MKQKEFVEQYDKEIIEVKDFTLVIDHLPSTFRQYKDEMSLKFAIWN